MAAAADFHSFAQDALTICKGNLPNAADKLAAELKRRPDVLRAYLLEYLTELQQAQTQPRPPTPTPKPKPKPITVHEHKRARRRTEAEKEAAIVNAGITAEAMRSAYDRPIDGRRIGDVRWGELTTIMQRYATSAGSFLRLGTDDATNAVLAAKLKAYAEVSDHSTPVRDVISVDQLQNLIDEARVEAPELISKGMQTYIAILQQAAPPKRIAP